MKKSIAFFEIFSLILAIVAFSFIVSETNDFLKDKILYKEKNKKKLIKNILMFIFGNNFVSAQETQRGLWTCPINNNGVRCQEYISEICNRNCNTTCFPGLRQDFSECRLGTCIDEREGTCAANTPRSLCQENGGRWDNRAITEIPQCRPGCCLTNGQALFRTEQQCNIIRQRTGLPAEFRTVTSELQCLSLANPEEEGACVLGLSNDGIRYNCRFIRRSECLARQGQFYGGFLCSNPQLNTTCVRQFRTSCLPNRDEVYWIDSCGNRENIYDANRVASWNNGLVLNKNESCSTAIGNNLLARQSSCGNCNYLFGNKCGTPVIPKDQRAAIGNFVCRDLSCIDEWGQKRSHGESWCAYQGKIGVEGEGNRKRSVDVPGSEHFRRTCLNGEIRTEVCGNGRTIICSESRDERTRFSSAACRANQWSLCIAANEAGKDEKNPTVAADKVKEQCDKYSDCFMKSVDLRGGKGNFAFSVCVPKYPPGFDTRTSGANDAGRELCALGTTKCTYVRVKKLFGSDKYNVLCSRPEGAETMNNLCMSLGDCGAHVNIVGDFTQNGFRVTSNRGNPPTLSSGYISNLRNLANPIRDQRVQPLRDEELVRLTGTIGSLQSVSVEDGMKKILGTFGMVSGIGGIVLMYAAQEGLIGLGAKTIKLLHEPGGIYSKAAGPPTPDVLKANEAAAKVTEPAIGAYMGAVAGALIGTAVVTTLIKMLGIDRGLPPAMVYALTAVGAFGGGVIGFYSVVGWEAKGYAIGLNAGIFAIVAVVLIIAILAFLGIGKKKETKYEFQCLPWQAPFGGAKCEECGIGPLPCTRYQCHSLGQACTFVENAEGGARCFNSGADDVTAPRISPNRDVLLGGYNYADINERGFRLVGPENNCVSRTTLIRMGITLNEFGQCKISNRIEDDYENMPFYFHSFNGRQDNLFRINHTMSFSIISLEAHRNELGIDSEFDDEPEERSQRFNELLTPDSNGNVNLYLRCADVNGNGRTSAPYNIRFCASPEPDRTAPILSSFSPESPAFVPINATFHRVTFFVNEPAECRWSEQDIPYLEMQNSVTCANSIGEGTFAGWPCNVTLPVSFEQANEKTFYFRCADMPWINETNFSSRNANRQSVNYVIRRTLNPLLITSVSPNNERIFSGGLPVSIDLRVTTSGGAQETTRTCKFNWGGRFIDFLETGTNNHRQRNINLFVEGNYTIPILCMDSVGNAANSTSNFSLEIDNVGPIITRVYNLGGMLNIITNEPSVCRFSFSSCSFSFNNGTLMRGDNLVHTTPFINNAVYHVQCRDRFDNPGQFCMIVRGATL